MVSPPLPHLLRISGALAIGLAEEGRPRERAVTAAWEDVTELRRAAGVGEDIRRLLAQAISKLRSTDTTECLTSLLHLAEAAVALNASRPRPFPHLPTELVALIIEFAQNPSPYFHERQQTNMALSLVSRDFHRLVRPRLLAEVHVTRPHQLPKLDAVRQVDPSRSSHVELFTLHLDLEKLAFRSDDDWLGFHLKPVVEWLASAPQVHLCISEMWVTSNMPRYVEDICGQRWDLLGFFEQRDGIAEAHLDLPDGHLYIDACRYHALLAPGDHLRQLHIPGGRPMREMHSLLRDLFDEDYSTVPHPWEVLATPHLAVFPHALSALLRETGGCLRHLEVTLVHLPQYATEMHLHNLGDLFNQLGNLQVLSLRLRDSAGRDRPAISKALEQGIQGLSKLRSLSIGGCGLLAGGCSAAAFRKMPHLESLTLFPVFERRDDLPEGALFDPIGGDRGLVQCLRTKGAFPRLGELEVQRGTGQGPSAALRRACEKRGVKLRMPVVGVREWLYVPEEGEDV